MAILETITVGSDTYDIGSPTTSTGLPIGTIISFMGTIAPLNYLACNGQTVNIADYPDLADFFLTQFGAKNKFGGDGTTTIGIPDLRGEFLRGTGTNSHTNQGNGAGVGVHQDATEIVSPFFNTNEGGLSIKDAPSSTYVTIIYNEDSYKQYTRQGYIGGATNKITSSSSGNSYTRLVKPTNTSVMYCILAK